LKHEVNAGAVEPDADAAAARKLSGEDAAAARKL
jgi:hypothetical protein